MPNKLDVDFVRAQFPAFSQPNLQGQAFFENAGGSYTCGQVIDRLNRFYNERKVQPYGPYSASALGGVEMDEARQNMAGLLGVRFDDVSFGPSTTQNTYVLAQAFSQLLDEGDAIIVTNQDHEANTGPWRRLAERGIEIREWAINPETGELDLIDLANLLDGKAKLLCFPHCSNIVGAINPVAEICALARTNGTFTCVDGVSYAPHGWPNVSKLGADIYLFSAYKTFGPHQGIMVMSPDVNQKLPNQGHYFNSEIPYARFTPAGPDHAQVAASAGMADYAETIFNHHFGAPKGLVATGEAVHDLFKAHETALSGKLISYLKTKNTLRLLGPEDANRKAPTFAIDTQSHNPAELASGLAQKGIMAGSGDFYAVRCLKALGVDPAKGVLRLSFVHYTSEGEVDKLCTALDELL